VVKSLKERMAEKRAAAAERGSDSIANAATTAAARPEPTPCRTCGSPAKTGAYCNACRAVRAQMTVARPKPELPKEKKSVSTSVATNQMVKTIEPTKIEKLSIEPERIKAIRIKHDLSQAKFGELLNVSNVTVSLWENGKTSPSPAFVRDILKLESEAPAIVDARTQEDEPPVTVAVAEPVTGEEPTLATADEPVKFVPDVEELRWLKMRLEKSDAEVAALTEYFEAAKKRIQELESDAIEDQGPPWSDGPHISDNLDAFRLLVRTFGIDTADRVVDLIRG
jgi:DNA-binding transcriptional regulator YiaG